jgi:hypothetical protein
MTERRLRSRAHIHVNKYISLSLPLDEIFDAAREIGRRALAAVAHPGRSRDRLTKARVDDEIVEHAAASERKRKFADAEKALVGLGFKKAEARAALDSMGPLSDEQPHTIMAAALRASKAPVPT